MVGGKGQVPVSCGHRDAWRLPSSDPDLPQASPKLLGVIEEKDPELPTKQGPLPS